MAGRLRMSLSDSCRPTCPMSERCRINLAVPRKGIPIEAATFLAKRSSTTAQARLWVRQYAKTAISPAPSPSVSSGWISACGSASCVRLNVPSPTNRLSRSESTSSKTFDRITIRSRIRARTGSKSSSSRTMKLDASGTKSTYPSRRAVSIDWSRLCSNDWDLVLAEYLDEILQAHVRNFRPEISADLPATDKVNSYARASLSAQFFLDY